MPLFIVQWKYKSSLGGPWQAGERVEVDAATAEVINRDSVGVLVAETERPVDAPPNDRMLRAAKAKRKGE